MSQEILNKIKVAEAEALSIKNAAKEKAENKIRKAEEGGKAALEESVRRATRENADKLELIKSKAAELLQSTKSDTEARAKAAALSAEIKMREAIKLAITAVLEECR